MKLKRVSICFPKKSTAASKECKSEKLKENPVEVPVEGILLDILSKIYEERKCG